MTLADLYRGMIKNDCAEFLPGKSKEPARIRLLPDDPDLEPTYIEVKGSRQVCVDLPWDD
jgi:hypothetical protein